MLKILTTEPPDISDDNFESYLASDDLLVHYFNEFLNLLGLPEPLMYNKHTGAFEVVSDVAESVSKRIKSALLKYKSDPLLNRTSLLPDSLPDNTYTVQCLDREQGVQWIKKERLPLFLKSDYYFEYRLAKLLSQVDSVSSSQSLLVDPMYRPWAASPETQACSSGKDGNRLLMTMHYASLRQSQALLSTQSVQELECYLKEGGPLSPATDPASSHGFPPPSSKSPEMERPTFASLLLERETQKQKHIKPMETRLTAITSRSSGATADVGTSFAQGVLRGAVSEEEGKQNCKAYGSRSSLQEPTEPCVENLLGGAPVTYPTQPAEESVTSETVNKEDESHNDYSLLDDDLHDSNYGLEEFKSFLQGTPGEKLFYLWMDIERLKTLQNQHSKNRHLVQMKDQYLLSAGPYTLSVELLSRLGITSTLCWREDKLHLVQAEITKSLLLYWCPRFWMVCSTRSEGSVLHMRLWKEQQLWPPAHFDPYPGALAVCYGQHRHPMSWNAPSTSPVLTGKADFQWRPLRLPKRSAWTVCLEPVSTSTHPIMPWAPSIKCLSSAVESTLEEIPPLDHSAKRMMQIIEEPEAGGDSTDDMLRALHCELQAGFCFLRFCERSGNQLWQNAIHFWSDLQRYHSLFFLDGPDPFKLQRQAQFLYATYLCSKAQMNIGAGEDCRRLVYAGLTPPFEELFDQAEEHVLAVLQEPWRLLVAEEASAFKRVGLQKSTRYVDTPHYRKLQALHRKYQSRLKQSILEEDQPPPQEPVLKDPDLWEKVPEEFRRYRFGSILRHRLEIQHFQSFLEENSAITDLACWLDVEQFRKIPQKDKAQREDSCKAFRSKYLNRKYYFGPGSPASREEQEEMSRLCGGWGRILRGRLSALALAEVQSQARRRIDRKWLPLFLATPQFVERRRSQVKEVEDQMFSRNRKKKEMWKLTDSAWMATSKEILVFRKALLNPVTCRQFQHFVSLKGDFLENGVLFWLEVQKYKELHHSHSDEATIQKKVDAIISCFIDSSIPPALQISIPAGQAQDILQRRTELGPYVFREAQMTVLGELFKLWPQFLAFRSSVEDAQVLPLLESNKEAQQWEMKRQRERKQAQEEANRQNLSFGEGLLGDSGSQEDLTMGTGSSDSTLPTRPVSWSYSKYMVALEQERLLLRRHVRPEQEADTIPRTGMENELFRRSLSSWPVREWGWRGPCLWWVRAGGHPDSMEHCSSSPLTCLPVRPLLLQNRLLGAMVSGRARGAAGAGSPSRRRSMAKLPWMLPPAADSSCWGDRWQHKWRDGAERKERQDATSSGPHTAVPSVIPLFRKGSLFL
ncbi:regulator of G-protein signaling 22 isoform X1 [Paramormyrops kingsleyae]|uniref:regulator of G-protein signaling 22 isoform X1 n=1 Tax=Paramormyrops kingsleyae TaxID=1676925 RepID=UPI003B96CCFE